MGIKRIVDVDLWSDELVETFTPEEKYFWLFLLTNPQTSQLGIYHITLKQMSFYLGYDIETCKKLIERFESKYKVIKYIDNELAIKNYLKFSIIKGGKPVYDCITRDLKQIKSNELIEWVFKNLDTSKCNATIQQFANKVITNKYKYINDNDNENDVSYHDTPTYRKKMSFEDVDYDTSKNPMIDKDKLEEIIKKRGAK